ncbi:MAG: aquaporin-like protein [Monoraphidium minutum]|nr:MAG: aquaporin-like protein [Monoraphidium minutum]
MAGGLLKADGRAGAKLAAAAAAEFLGTMLFALVGAAAPYRKAAVANGLALAVLVYATANVSGGHLNPAVTAATLATGHVSAARALLYVCAQIAGSMVASALHLLLIPKAVNVGCFAPGSGVSLWQAFGWELLMTATLVAVIYAVAVGDKNVAAPAAIGITLVACATTALDYSGASLNPARVIGPAVVFGCGAGAWKVVAVYVAAQLAGGLSAALFSWPLYGTGPFFGSWGDARAEAQEALTEALHDTKEAIRGTYERLQDHS